MTICIIRVIFIMDLPVDTNSIVFKEILINVDTNDAKASEIKKLQKNLF